MHDDQLTPKERESLESLPRESVPSAGLEDRVVGALRERKLLGAKRRRVVSLGRGRLSGLVAAGVVLVAGSFAVGRLTVSPVTPRTGELRSPAETRIAKAAAKEEMPVAADPAKAAGATAARASMPVMMPADEPLASPAAAGLFESAEVSPAATVQWAGTFYLLALERLASMDAGPGGDDAGEARQGREVALRTLYAAADRIARMMPREAVSRQLLYVIGNGAAVPGDTTRVTSTKTGWF